MHAIFSKLYFQAIVMLLSNCNLWYRTCQLFRPHERIFIWEKDVNEKFKNCTLFLNLLYLYYLQFPVNCCVSVPHNFKNSLCVLPEIDKQCIYVESYIRKTFLLNQEVFNYRARYSRLSSRLFSAEAVDLWCNFWIRLLQFFKPKLFWFCYLYHNLKNRNQMNI